MTHRRRSRQDRPNIQVVVRGEVGERFTRRAQDAVTRVMRYIGDPILFVRVTLILEPDPARERPAIAQAVLDVNGRPVRAHVASRDMREAINHLEERLRHQLEILTEHRQERRKHGAVPRKEGEWRHGYPPSHRPDFFPRPVEERQVVSRQPPAGRPMTPEEAADEMELLDCDFHLFVDVSTGEESVIWREPDGALHRAPLGGSSPRPVLQQAEAVAMLDLSGQAFVFYRDAGSGRGAVVYHRYDGHYGLLQLEPASIQELRR
jgi:ribosome-associated translation inhibitor RaiA